MFNLTLQISLWKRWRLFIASVSHLCEYFPFVYEFVEIYIILFNEVQKPKHANQAEFTKIMMDPIHFYKLGPMPKVNANPGKLNPLVTSLLIRQFFFCLFIITLQEPRLFDFNIFFCGTSFIIWWNHLEVHITYWCTFTNSFLE